MAMTQDPKVEWDGQHWSITLPLEKKIVTAFISPSFIYEWKIRESGGEEWSVGFEAPVQNCTFTDLKPDTEYVVQVTAKNGGGKRESALSRVQTDSEGRIKDVLSFPDP